MNIKILKGEEVDQWIASRRKVLKDPYKGCRIDGIMDKRRYAHIWTAVLNPKYLSEINEVGVEC
jgi:hypothetical protein